ncbi:hypothetical protein D3C80_1320590 [compost metagenome]
MKFTANIFLIIFMIFLLAPTIVCVIEKNADTSIFYSVAEEENVHKQYKAFLHFDVASEIVFPVVLSSKAILSDNLLKHDSIAASIIIPPPDEV